MQNSSEILCTFKGNSRCQPNHFMVIPLQFLLLLFTASVTSDILYMISLALLFSPEGKGSNIL